LYKTYLVSECTVLFEDSFETPAIKVLRFIVEVLFDGVHHCAVAGPE
jgi:hypothetical protein